MSNVGGRRKRSEVGGRFTGGPRPFPFSNPGNPNRLHPRCLSPPLVSLGKVTGGLCERASSRRVRDSQSGRDPQDPSGLRGRECRQRGVPTSSVQTQDNGAGVRRETLRCTRVHLYCPNMFVSVGSHTRARVRTCARHAQTSHTHKI